MALSGKTGLSQNVAPKFVAKVTRENSETVLKLLTKLLLTRLKSFQFLYGHIFKFWIISSAQMKLFRISICAHTKIL